MTSVLIKGLLILSVVCCSSSYAALTFEIKPNKPIIKQDNKKPNKNKKESLYDKYRKAQAEAKGVHKEDYTEEKTPAPKFDKAKIARDRNKPMPDTLKLTISGYATFCGAAVNNNNVYYDGEKSPTFVKTNQKSDAKTKMDKEGLDLIAGEAAIKFKADGEWNSWTRYGALLEIQAEKEDFDLDKAFGFIESDIFGNITIGNFKGPDNDYVFSGQQLLLANFGIDGIVTSQIDYPTGCLNPRFPIGVAVKATKIAYYSPLWNGLQLGFSYTPDTKHVGHDKRDRTIGDKSSGNNNLYAKGDGESEKPCGLHNIALGIKYDNDFGNGFKVRAGFVYITEKTQDITTNCYEGDITADSKPELRSIKLNNVSSWIASLELSYKNFSIAGGFYKSGKSRLPKASEFTKDGKTVTIPAFMVDKNGDTGHAWNIGAKWRATDRLEFTGVFHSASRKLTQSGKAKVHAFTFAIDYKLSDHFSLFGEVDWIKGKSSPFACSLYNLNHKEGGKDALLQVNSWVFSAGMTVKF